MSGAIEEPLLSQFSKFLSRRAGLHFPPAHWPTMLRGVQKASAEFGFSDVRACLQALVTSTLDRQQVEVLASHLSVGETYFFRDPALFEALECEILPPLIAARRAASDLRLRIWSAGCCTGEEPYSIAILLHRMIPDLENWNIRILGTDINPHFLAKAEAGIYREWSFRGVPDWLRRKYFESVHGGHRLVEHCRELVTFDYLNLADDAYPSPLNHTNAVDLVLCRNVLMYFDAATIKAVQHRLGLAVVEGGWVCVGPSEAVASGFNGFESVQFEGAFLFRKKARGAVPVNAHPAEVLRGWTPLPSASAPIAAAPADIPPAAGKGLPEPEVPDSCQAALACCQRGDHSQARRLLIDSGDRSAQALALLARTCANLGELDEARAWCEAAIAQDKVDPGLRYLFGSVLQEAGLLQEAVNVLRQAIFLEQDHVLAHFALGNLYRRLEDGTRAAKHLAMARQLLAAHLPDAVLPDSDGLTAGRLLEILAGMEDRK